MARLGRLDLAALGVTLAAFCLRCFHVARYGLNGDEALGARLIGQGLAAIVDATTSGDPHPPLYYTMLMGWAALAGDGELSLRFLGLAAGVLLVPLTYRLGRWLFPGPAPLLAAVVLAANPYQVWYAHEARMYLPEALFAALSMALLVDWLRRRRVGSLVGYAAATTLALYTHYYAVFLVMLQNLLVLALWAERWLPRRQSEARHDEAAVVGGALEPAIAGRLAEGSGKRLRAPVFASRPIDAPRLPPMGHWLVAQVAVFLSFLPWLVIARDLMRTYNALGWSGPLPILAETLVRYSVGHTWDWWGNVLVGGAFAALAAVGIAVALRDQQAFDRKAEAAAACRSALLGRAGWLLLGWALFPGTLGFVASFARPMFAPRYLMVSAAAFALALGVGMAAAWRWRRLAGAAALVGVLVVSGRALHNLYFDPTYARSGYDRLGRYLADHGQPGDAILVAAWTQKDMFTYYYRHRLGGQLRDWLFPASDPLDPSQTIADVEKIMAEHRGIWYLGTDSARYDPQRVVERQLATHHHKVFERWFLNDRLVYYASGARPSEVRRQVVARFGADIVLDGASLEPVSVRPGEVARATLVWEAASRPSGNYKVSIILKDPDGHVLNAIDREPADGFAPTSTWEPRRPVWDRYGLLVPPTALPGSYEVVAKLYDAVTGQPLPAVGAEGARLPDGAVVGQLAVVGAPAPAVAERGPTVPVGVDLGPLRLVGYDAPPDVEFAPGQPLGLRLYWRPLRRLQDGRLRLTFVDEEGRAAAGAESALAPSWYPVGNWEPGRELGVYAEFAVPARLETGRYRLRLGLSGVSEVVERGARPADVTLATIRVVAPSRNLTPPRPQHALDARFGDLARLVGYDGPAAGGKAVRAGGSLHLTLHWQAVGQSDVSYKVFVHLLGPDGKLHGQRDAPPLGGRRPTTGWIQGEYLADPYEVPLADDAPPGEYSLRVGLYEEASGRRLPLADGSGDSLALLTFNVVGQ